VFCGCCGNILDWIAGDLNMSSVLKDMKAYACYLFTCGINVFRMASSNSSLIAKYWACAYIEFLAGFSRGLCTIYFSSSRSQHQGLFSLPRPLSFRNSEPYSLTHGKSTFDRILFLFVIICFRSKVTRTDDFFAYQYYYYGDVCRNSRLSVGGHVSLCNGVAEKKQPYLELSDDRQKPNSCHRIFVKSTIT
jgi:hypothetical protein